MKISVITACYNNAGTIARCIDSVYQQTYPDIEHIVIDGCSSDGTPAVIRSIPNRVSRLISEEDDGIYDALNKGLRLASGDIIGFTHADDFLASPFILSRIADRFSRPATSGVYGDLNYVDKETGATLRNWKSRSFERRFLIYGWMPAHPTLFLRRKVYQKHGYFDTSFKISADYDFMLRILNDDEIALEYLPELIMIMQVGGTSNKSLKNLIRKSTEDLRAIRRNNVGGIHTLVLKNIRKIGQFI